MEQTARLCAGFYGVYYNDVLTSSSKRGRLLKARQTAIYIMTDVLGQSHSEASLFFDKSRSLATHYRKRAIKAMQQDEKYKQEVQRLSEKIKNLNSK